MSDSRRGRLPIEAFTDPPPRAEVPPDAMSGKSLELMAAMADIGLAGIIAGADTLAAAVLAAPLIQGLEDVEPTYKRTLAIVRKITGEEYGQEGQEEQSEDQG